MATNNSSNQDYSNESDGFILGGGSTKRDLTVTGANITLTGSGTNTYTFPAATDTLVGRDSTDTLTNKTLTSPVLNTGVSGTAIKDEDNMASNSATALATQQSIKAYVDTAIDAAFLAAHPVGCSVVGADSGANPNTYLRGCSGTTWARVEGRFIVGASDSDTDFDVNDTGGAKTHTHALSNSGYAKSHHTGSSIFQERVSTANWIANITQVLTSGAANSTTRDAGIGLGGATDSANGLPPFIAKYIWQRTA